MMNLNIEKSVLGIALLEEDFEIIVKTGLKIEYFSDTYNKLIFDVLCKMHKSGMLITTITLIEELRKINALDDCGGISYITSLLTHVPSKEDLSYCVSKLEELYQRRCIAKQLSDITEALQAGNLANIAQQIKDIGSSIEFRQSYEHCICDFSEIKLEQNSKVVYTGFYKLDKAIRGIESGTLSILTGEPGSGKTTILNQIIASALKDGNKAFLYSGELTHSKIKEWMIHTLATESDLSPDFNKMGDFSLCPKNSFIDAANAWIKNKLFIMRDDYCLTVDNLREMLVFLHEHMDVNLFVLDNLMSLTSSASGEQLSIQKALMQELKQIAKELQIVIILVAHPNKESLKLNTHSIADVSGASEIVNLSDYVFKLVPDGSETLFYVLKNRISGLKNIYLELSFDKNRRRFYSESKAELYQKYV